MAKLSQNQIVKPDLNPLRENGNIMMPAMMIPGFRTSLAIERGVEKNILIHAWGGLGDQICAEPSIRFACNRFKDCKISVISEYPELFSHLPLANLFDLKKGVPENPEDYFLFYTVYPHGHLQWEFMLHLHIHCVDYSALCMWRGMLPNDEKNIVLKPSPKDFERISNIDFERCVVVHAGKHWQSKTFPKWWWDEVIEEIISEGYTPILIGAKGADNSGTVDVESDGCLDMRNMLSIMESVALLQKCKVLITNDSSPLHMAASGNCHIGFISTIKHPDFITHYRNGSYGWRMQSLGKKTVYDELNLCPNNREVTTVENVGNKILDWLPETKHVARWAIETIGG